MGDDVRLHEELRRLKQLINSDVSMLARFDPEGSGEIDPHEWEWVEQLVAGRLEQRVAGSSAETRTEHGVQTLTEPEPGEVALEVFELDLGAIADREAAPRIDVCDELVLEHLGPDPESSGRARHDYSILTVDARQLGTIERLESEFASKRKLRSRWSSPETWFTIRPRNGDIVRIRRTEAFLGEFLEVQSIFGRTMARVTWKPFRLGYHYRVLSESSRVLNVVGRNAGDFEMDISEAGTAIGTIEYNRRARAEEADIPPRGDGATGATSVAQRVIRVAPGHLTPSLRWGLLGAALFADRPPRLFSGLFR